MLARRRGPPWRLALYWAGNCRRSMSTLVKESAGGGGEGHVQNRCDKGTQRRRGVESLRHGYGAGEGQSRCDTGAALEGGSAPGGCGMRLRLVLARPSRCFGPQGKRREPASQSPAGTAGAHVSAPLIAKLKICTVGAAGQGREGVSRVEVLKRCEMSPEQLLQACQTPSRDHTRLPHTTARLTVSTAHRGRKLGTRPAAGRGG